ATRRARGPPGRPDPVRPGHGPGASDDRRGGDVSAGRPSARRAQTTRVGAVLAGVVTIALALATLAGPPPAAASRPAGSTGGLPAGVAQPSPPDAEPSPGP